jgi:hypothetical protein
MISSSIRELRARMREYNTFSVTFKDSSRSDLNEIFSQHGSDKGGNRFPSTHAYADFYEVLLHPLRFERINIFECGIGSNNSAIKGYMGDDAVPGASLRAWRDWFPLAQVYGADIDSGAVFQESRIQTFQMDQTDRQSIRRYWAQVLDGKSTKFDLMVDDGLHTVSAAYTLFHESSELLSERGFYVIEDLSSTQRAEIQKLVDSDKFTVHHVDFGSSKRGSINGSLVVIRKKSSL